MMSLMNFDSVEGLIEETQAKDEQGLESLGRPVNDYFQDHYKKDETSINLKDSGINLTDVNLGNKVGEVAILQKKRIIKEIGKQMKGEKK